MANGDISTAARLRELLHYDPQTVVFTRLMRTSNQKGGDIAGSARADGYLQISIEGQRFYAHRLAWLYMTDEWPEAKIDHVNGHTDENRSGLRREATRAENGCNRDLPRNNTSGFNSQLPIQRLDEGRSDRVIRTRVLGGDQFAIDDHVRLEIDRRGDHIPARRSQR